MFKPLNVPLFRQMSLAIVFATVFCFVLGLTTLTSVPTASTAFAAEDAAEAADDAGGGGDEAAGQPAPISESYLIWYLKALGPIFAPVFFVLSVFLVTYVILNYMAINRNNIMPQPMVDQFAAQLDEKNYQEAYETGKASESSLGKILAAGLAKMGSGYEAAQQSMSDVAEEEIMRLEQRLGYVSMIASISPMVGLLGTVYGMVESFNVIARSASAPQASELAGGISTALITTEIGLFIAIPAIIIYEILRNKLATLVLELTVQTENLMSRFKGQGPA